MARPLPQRDPQAVADLIRRAKEARASLPGIVQQIEDLICKVNPIELLSQLTLLFQTHPTDEQPNRDESARWQVRIEAFQSQLESLAIELYSPHEEWCLANLGFTVQDAFALAKVIGDGFADRMHSLREAKADIVTRVQADPAVALSLALPPSIGE